MNQTEFQKDAELFQRVTGIKLCQDGLLTVMAGKPVINTIIIDQKLMLKYQYPGTMNEFIEKQFGQEIKSILEKWEF